MARLLAGWLRSSRNRVKSEKLRDNKPRRRKRNRRRRNLPPPGRVGLLYDVDVEGGVDHLGELEEVGVGGVGRAAAEDSLQKAGELSKGPRLIRKDEVAVALDVHLVVEHDPAWLVVLVDDLCLDALDVLAVVVDVLLWCLAVLEDVVVVPVIDDQDASGLQHVVHVLDASLVVPEVTMVVDEVGERVAHADDGVVASARGL